MLYNENQKLRYMNQGDLSEDAKDVFKFILATAAKVELQEGEDLSNFNRQQVINLLKMYNSRSRHYLRLLCNHFSKYYKWCYTEGLVAENNFTDWYDINLARPIIQEVLPAELIDEKMIDHETMLEFIDKVKDKSNKFLLYAPYVGIKGNDLEDLRYLRAKDLNEDEKTIKLYSGRIAQVDDLFIKLLKDADSSLRYDKNGDGAITKKSTDYCISEYVLKPCSSVENSVVSSKLLVARYRTIKEQTGNKFLNPMNVYKNGMINFVKDYFEKRGISLKHALFKKTETGKKGGANSLYVYNSELENAIKEFGEVLEPRMLRYQMTEVYQYYND
jgi:hypothetical protein